REGGIFMPGPPSFPSFFGPSGTRMQINANGKVVEATGNPQMQMPYLLGDLAQFLIDRLPQDNQLTWEVDGFCSITEGSSGRPFGRGMFPRAPRFGPRFPEQPKAERQATEKSFYTRGAAVGDMVTIQKRYEMKAPAAGTSPGLDLSGDATITFDAKDGFPR